MSGHGKKPADRGALTAWIQRRERLVRRRKEIGRARLTHFLETAEVATCQNTKRIDRARHTHFLEAAEGADCEDTERNRPIDVHSLSGDDRRSNLSGHRKKLSEQGTLTSWRRKRERLERARNKIDRAKRTHKLETEGETCQNNERNPSSEAYSHPEGWERERHIKTWKETNRSGRTYWLDKAEGATCQKTKRNRPSQAHSLPGDGRGSDLSER